MRKEANAALSTDTMSGKYAEWVESEVLPLVESKTQVKLTKDPDGRATMGAVPADRAR